MDTAKENIPKQFMIGDTCFTSLENIGGNLCTRHQKNVNHVYKEVNDLLSVIIILGTYVLGGEAVFFNGMPINDMGERAHVLKNLHESCVVGAFDKVSYEGSIWNVPMTVLSFILHKLIFLHFIHHGKTFMTNI